MCDTLPMLRKAFGDQSMPQKNIYTLYNEFKALKMNRVLDVHQRVSTHEGHFQKIKDLMLEIRRFRIRYLVDSVEISFGSAKTILKEVLCFERVESRLVPKSRNFL